MRQWAPESFVACYDERSRSAHSFLCVGLDPTEDHIPPQFGDLKKLGSWWAYLSEVIDLAGNYAAVCKPQVAYYERVMRLGGMDLLFEVVQKIRGLGMLSILDAKRQDIGSTDRCYADWILAEPDNGLGYGFNACTRNIYLGETFLQNDKEENWWPYMLKGKMPVLMCRTSNNEAPWMQDLALSVNQPKGMPVGLETACLYQWVAGEIQRLDAEVAQRSDGVACIGAVVGATYPGEAEICRGLAPDVFFLIPGYGAQGGVPTGAVAGFPKDGRLLGTVNSSRGITQAWRNKGGSPKDGDPLKHVEEAMAKSRAELNEALSIHLGGADPYG